MFQVTRKPGAASMIAAALAVIVMAAPVAAQDYNEVPNQTVDATWLTGGFAWEGRGTIESALLVSRNAQGALILCGVFQFNGAKGGAAPQAQRAHILTINGRRKVQDFGWMPIIQRGKSFVGQSAKCREYPGVQVPAGARFGIDLARTRF